MERTSLHNDSLLYASLIAILLLISYWFTTRCFKIISGIEGMGLGMWGDKVMPSCLQAVWWGDLGTGCLGTSHWAPRSPWVSPSAPPGAAVLGQWCQPQRCLLQEPAQSQYFLFCPQSSCCGAQWRCLRQRFRALGPSQAVLLPPAPWSSSDRHCVQGHAEPRACISSSPHETSACTGPAGSYCNLAI